MSNIIIKTSSNPYCDIFEYSILSSTSILVKKINDNRGWWFNLFIDITDTNTSVTRKEKVGVNRSNIYKAIQLDFDLGCVTPICLNEKIFVDEYKDGIILDSTKVKDEDIIFDENDIVVIVSGIVYVSNNCLDGYHSRSLFSAEERYEQIIETLKSIIMNIPNSKIILLEQSKFFPEDKLLNMAKYCDYIIQYKNDVKNDYYSNIQKINKGLGEMYVTTHFLSLIKNKDFNTILKIAARNILTSNFDINNFTKETTFRPIYGDGRLGIIVFSCVYSIKKDALNLFIEHQKLWLYRDSKEPIEHVLTMFVESIPELNLIPFLHIKGAGGTNNNPYYL